MSHTPTPPDPTGSFDAMLSELLSVPEPHVRGRLFERAVRDWLRTDRALPSVAVELWEDSPHVSGPDLGVDLVAEDRQGQLTAVQVKLHAADSYVTKGEVDSFLSASANGLFVRRLLVTTGPLGRNARDTIAAQQTPVDVVGLEQLRATPVCWPTLAELQAGAVPVAGEKPQPRPHQIRALNDLVPHLEAGGRVQATMACGTGKSLTALWAAERSGARTVLLLAPAIALIDQLVAEWSRACSWDDAAFLPVCSAADIDAQSSDPDVQAREDGDMPADMAEQLPRGATTDPVRIAAWLDQHPAAVKVVVATYQSSLRVAEALGLAAAGGFDLAICDEAHRLGGRPNLAFGTVLDDQKLPARTKLFLTATPRVLAPHLKNRTNGDSDEQRVLLSMDDPAVFGPVAHTLSFRAAIEHDPPLLAGFRTVVVGVRPDKLDPARLANARVQFGDREVDADLAARVEAIRVAMGEDDLRRVLAYWSRVSTAKAATSLLNTAGPVNGFDVDARTVSGSDRVTVRNTTLRTLKCDNDRRTVVSNARCLTEGVDVPAVDAVAFAQPRRSVVDVVQAVGRALRLAPGKHTATVVVPLLLPADDDPDPSQVNFEVVWEVLAALASQDEMLTQQLNQLRAISARRPLTANDLADTLVFAGELLTMPQITGALVTSVVERLSSSVWVGYSHLLAYHAHHGHSVPRGDAVTACGFKLGRWCESRRSDRRLGRLDPGLETALNELGFPWDIHEANWQASFEFLVRFKAEHGHANPKATHVTEDGFHLGGWCSRQRASRGDLSAEQVAALESIGFAWDAHQKQLDALAEFRAEHGHCNVPPDHPPVNGVNLNRWCNNRRVERREGRLNPGLETALDDLEFVWNPRTEGRAPAIEALIAFKAEHGDCNVPQRHPPVNGVNLGQWCADRRKDLKAGRLSSDLKAELDALGFIWDLGAHRQQQAIEALTQFTDKHGHCNVPPDHPPVNGVNLNSWCNNRRQDRRNGRLDPDLETELNSLGFVWQQYEAAFQMACNALAKFKAEHGHCNVPKDHPPINGVNLFSWGHSKRRDRRNGKLSADRVAALDALGFVWEPLKKAA